MVVANENFSPRTNEQMNIAALNLKVARIDVCVLKSKFYFISTGKENMIAEQIKKSKKTSSYKIGTKKAPVAHARIENGHHLRIPSEARGKKNDGNKGKNRPEQTIDIGNKIQVILKQNLFCPDLLIDKFFNVLTEINRDRNDRKKQRRKEKRAQVFANDISINSQQASSELVSKHNLKKALITRNAICQVISGNRLVNKQKVNFP